MRKLLATVSAITVAAALAGGIAYTANIPLYSSSSPCFDSSQTLACANQIVGSVNSGVTGNFAYVPGPVGNTGGGTTTQDIVLASAIIPTGSLVAAGQGYRARCAGTSGTTTTAKYGITIGRSMAASMEIASLTAPNWDLELQFQAATNPVTANYTWMARGLAASAAGAASAGGITVNSGNDTTVTDNNANFGLPVSCVIYGGVATGFATMMNFAVEQLR